MFHLDEELLALDCCWARENQFSSVEQHPACRPNSRAGPIPRRNWPCKLDSGFEEDREKERERKERWRKGRVWSWVGRELEKDSEQDQNTVYEILK